MVLDLSRYPQSGDILVDGKTVGTTGTSSSQPLEVYSPEWWLRRLLLRLVDRAVACREYHDFYEGRQPLAFASQKFLSEYGNRFGRFPANFMPKIVDVEKNRLIVDGFRFGRSPDADKSVWRIWQDNQMDAESQIAHEIALSKGVAYAAIDPFAASPSITIEDPTETIVETAPGNRRTRVAALKVYTDDDGYSRAYLYLPTEIYAWRSQNRRTDSISGALTQMRWVPYVEEGGDFPVTNPLGVVPIVPLINRPQRNGMGRSEIEPVMGNQLAINFLRYAALVGSDTAALPQRWAKNLQLEIDETTGQAKAPFQSSVRDVRLWTTRRPTPDEMAEYDGTIPEPAFGQFPEATLQPFVIMVNSEIKQMATISDTPHYMLVGDPTSVPMTGESRKTADGGLVNKVEAQQIHFGEGWEETMRVSLLAAGQTSKAARSTSAETMWRDAETRNEAARTDSILKQYAAGLLPDEFALGELGYSQQQIERIKEIRASEAPEPVEPAPAEPPAPVVRSFGRDAAGNPVITRQAG